MPELTGPLVGLAASYAAGSTITVGIPVDEDARRVQITLFEYGGRTMLGSSAADISPSGTASLEIAAGTLEAPPGNYFFEVDLCSTTLCTSPLERNSFDQQGSESDYTQRRSRPGEANELCRSTIPITAFRIE
jgi:hypothetical protein